MQATRKLFVVLAAALGTSSCHRPPADAVSRTREGWDLRSDPRRMNLGARRYEELALPEARRGALAKKPWADGYWPYFRKSLAFRYADATPELPSLEAQLADARSNPGRTTLSPSEKYDLARGDASFALTQNSWQAFIDRFARFGDDFDAWSWLGICNGWSAAALAEPAPLHAVAVTAPGGTEILFHPGDLRALASRAYDLNAIEGGTRLGGSRCEAERGMVPVDAGGRPLDGQLGAERVGFRIELDFSAGSGAMLVRTLETTPRSLWLLLREPAATLTGEKRVHLYASRADVSADLLARTPGQRALPEGEIAVHLYKACRDVNPGTLHLALVELVSDAAPVKSGFVVELSREDQVWNHPVWGFDASVGRPRLVATEPPEMRGLRSPAAVYAADVKTRLVYAAGVGMAPRTDYPMDEDARIDWQALQTTPSTYTHVDLSYTLELDASGFVVGGEWLEGLDRRTNVPDFFWRAPGKPTDRLRNGEPSPLAFSQLQKLLACSRRTPDVEVAGTPAVSCELAHVGQSTRRWLALRDHR